MCGAGGGSAAEKRASVLPTPAVRQGAELLQRLSALVLSAPSDHHRTRWPAHLPLPSIPLREQTQPRLRLPAELPWQLAASPSRCSFATPPSCPAMRGPPPIQPVEGGLSIPESGRMTARWLGPGRLRSVALYDGDTQRPARQKEAFSPERSAGPLSRRQARWRRQPISRSGCSAGARGKSFALKGSTSDHYGQPADYFHRPLVSTVNGQSCAHERNRDFGSRNLAVPAYQVDVGLLGSFDRRLLAHELDQQHYWSLVR